MSIEIAIEDIDPPSISWVGRYRLGCERLVEALGEPRELSILLCSDAVIQALNRRYRGRDYATDVLSFPQDTMEAGVAILGDIVISLPTATRNAEDVRRGAMMEALRLTVHGLLHLLGFDHGERGHYESDTMLVTEQYIYNTLLRRMKI